MFGDLYTPVKFLPEDSTHWFSSTDKLAGTDAAIGKAGDNSKEWSISYSSMDYSKILITGKRTYNPEFMIFVKSQLQTMNGLYPSFENTQSNSNTFYYNLYYETYTWFDPNFKLYTKVTQNVPLYAEG